ncbi:AmmeMemoRadiSam system protein B [candidate division KSB1 bacterium]|nr:AmmeMemoRadiSam system protein B [candidate division KSB1 bacterium]
MKRNSRASHKESHSIQHPKIRRGIQPIQYQDENDHLYVGLKDPLQLRDAVILLPYDLFCLLRYFDGTHSLDDIIAQYARQFGNFLPLDRLQKMIKKMDDSLLLDNQRSQKKVAKIESAFRDLDIRDAACAGSSYAAERSALEKELSDYFDNAAIEKTVIDKFLNKSIKAMIVPHIDLRLGGATYAAAYKILRHAQPVNLFVILGISHQPTKHAFVMTTKDFRTPLGLVKTDKRIVMNIANRCQTDFFVDEIVHRNEHSIEFQTLFLQQTQTDFRIVPILCSFSHLQSDVQKRQIVEFTTALRREIGGSGSVCFIASVDFSHIGPGYGDDNRPDSFVLAEVERADRAVLTTLAQHDLGAFEHQFKRSNNKYNICGYPALRTLYEFLPASEAMLLRYDNAIMDEERSTVTFASMIFS